MSIKLKDTEETKGVYRHTIYLNDGEHAINCNMFWRKEDMIIYYKETPKTETEVQQGESQVPYGIVPYSHIKFITIN